MEFITPDVIKQLLQYPILILVLAVLWFWFKSINRLSTVIEKLIEKIGDK
jgi:hypothetical protein